MPCCSANRFQRLVVRDKNGEIYTVRYEAVNAMLLNEFLKEHKKVEGQQATIAEQQASIAELKSTVAQQQRGMEVLTAQLKQQAAQIQKVSAQLAAASPSGGGLEASKPAPQVVNNPLKPARARETCTRTIIPGKLWNRRLALRLAGRYSLPVSGEAHPVITNKPAT